MKSHKPLIANTQLYKLNVSNIHLNSSKNAILLRLSVKISKIRTRKDENERRRTPNARYNESRCTYELFLHQTGSMGNTAIYKHRMSFLIRFENTLSVDDCFLYENVKDRTGNHWFHESIHYVRVFNLQPSQHIIWYVSHPFRANIDIKMGEKGAPSAFPMWYRSVFGSGEW